MIREHRSRAKLEAYYEKFARDGVLDPNVHPWVADSWQQSKKHGGICLPKRNFTSCSYSMRMPLSI